MSPLLETGGALNVFIRATRWSGLLHDMMTFTQLFQDSQYWSSLEDRPTKVLNKKGAA